MNPLTEQQIDAEVSRYEPLLWNGEWLWSRGVKSGRNWCVPSDVFDELSDGCLNGFYTVRATYDTREAAFADLRQAIRAANSNDHDTQN